MKQPDITVLVVSYKTRDLLDDMFAALDAASRGIAIQVIVVDNASADGSVEHIQRHYPEVELIANEENIGFGRANNQALPLFRGRYLLLLNADASIQPDAISKSMSYMQKHPDCGVLGARLIDGDGIGDRACRIFPSPWNNFARETGLMAWVNPLAERDRSEYDCGRENCDWVPGCYYLIRREVIDQLALFDPRYFLYFEEVDYCRAVKKAGWKISCLSDVVVTHLIGASSEGEQGVARQNSQLVHLMLESEMLYYRKHHGIGTVLLDLFLLLLADLIKMAKDIVKGRGILLAMNFRHLQTVIAAFVGTRCGARPMR